MAKTDLSTIESKNEEISRTLYLRTKKVIKNEDDVKHLFDDYERFIIHRKKSRNCFVVFKDKETQQKHLEKLKKVENIFVAPREPLDPKKVEEKIDLHKKKIKTYRKYSEKPVFTETTLLVKNIPVDVKTPELIAAFPGCKTVHFFETKSTKVKRAKLKMESMAITEEYIKKERIPPVFNGKTVHIATPSFLRKIKKQKKLRKIKKEKVDN